MVSKTALSALGGLLLALGVAVPGQSEAAVGGVTLKGVDHASNVITVGRGYRSRGFARGFHGRGFSRGFRGHGFRGFHGRGYKRFGFHGRGFKSHGFKRHGFTGRGFKSRGFKRFYGHGYK